jgi:hypothetical protein
MAAEQLAVQTDSQGIAFIVDAIDYSSETRDDDLHRVAGALCGAQFTQASISQISGGITNMLFKMQSSDNSKPVLVRVFGAKTEMMINRQRDNGEKYSPGLLFWELIFAHALSHTQSFFIN